MVGIATMGMFQPCCGNKTGGGGAPPYRPYNEEKVAPVVFVHKVKMKTINSPEDIVSKIHVRLKDDE